jgi:cation diffusion facilitator CzcD-associated flavoprotein CzcO
MTDVQQAPCIGYEVGIIGAGFGGVIAALELKRTDRHSFVLFERAAEPGGVWRDNIYPGCACDVSTNLYCIESEPNPDWTTFFGGQVEIFHYLQDVISRNDLQRKIRYETTIVDVRFMEDQACWQLTDQHGQRHTVRALILATGPYSRPAIPDIPGRMKFKGSIFHSSAWDPLISIENKKVAVVGTGASALQIISAIAPAAARLEVFQRHAPWVLPRGDRKVSALERWIYRHFPFVQTLFREGIFWFMELIGLAFLGNERLLKVLEWLARHKLAKEVSDPRVREQLTPDYKIGCKRVLFSDTFYPTFNRSNVELITVPIREIDHDGIVTADGRHYGVDVIVMATGFFLADTDNLLHIVGRGGRVLKDVWDECGAQTYLGVHSFGYPNMSFLLGPNSGLGHSSLVKIMESQMVYILQWLDRIEQAGPGEFLDIRPDIQQRYNDEVQQRLAGTVWASGCTSSLLNRHGRNSTIYPGLSSQYKKLMEKFNGQDYQLLRADSR